jgi:hypothetical protein
VLSSATFTHKGCEQSIVERGPSRIKEHHSFGHPLLAPIAAFTFHRRQYTLDAVKAMGEHATATGAKP